MTIWPPLIWSKAGTVDPLSRTAWGGVITAATCPSTPLFASAKVAPARSCWASTLGMTPGSKLGTPVGTSTSSTFTPLLTTTTEPLASFLSSSPGASSTFQEKLLGADGPRKCSMIVVPNAVGRTTVSVSGAVFAYKTASPPTSMGAEEAVVFWSGCIHTD